MYFEKIEFGNTLIAKRSFSLLLLFCCLIPYGVGQSEDIDSLRQVLVSYPEDDSFKIDLLAKISYAYSFVSPSLSDKYGKQALTLAQSLELPESEAMAYQVCGIAFSKIGDYDKALDCYVQSLKIFETLGMEEKALASLHNISGIYYYQHDYQKALEYAEQVLEKNLAGKDDNRIADGYQSVGMIYQGMSQYQQALTYYQKALLKYRQLNNSNREGATLVNMGGLLLQQGNHQGALENFFLAKNIYEKSANEIGITDLVVTMGHTYTLMGQYAKARNALQEGIKRAKSRNFVREIRDAHLYLAELDSATGRFASAFDNYQQFIRIRDSLSDESSNARLAQIKTEFEVYQKDQELVLLQNQAALKEAELTAKEATIRQQRWIVISASLIMTLLALGLTFLFYSNQRQRRAQNEIERQKIELEFLNKSKDQWFSIISHDFRSPLTFLQSALTLINEGDLNSKEMQMLTLELETRVKRTSTLLDNLLYWAQSEIRDLIPNPREVNIQTLFKEVITFYDPHMQRKGISLHSAFDGEYVSLADREMLNLILRNLIGHAVAYSPTDGTIRIHVRENKNKIYCSISDEGNPIPPEQIPSLFSPHNPTTTNNRRNQKGMGLGLWLSREFLHKNQGEMWVESQKEEGVTFHFTLPMASLPSD